MKVVLDNADDNEKLVESDGIAIKKADLKTLGASEWVNDNIFNAYMKLIVKEANGDNKIKAFDTYFYLVLSKYGFEGVKTWTKNENIFDYDIWIIPVHIVNHWCVAVVHLATKKIEYFDSMLSENKTIFPLLRSYISSEMKDKKNRDISIEEWQSVCRKDIPKQKNSWDCGVFACQYALYAINNVPMNFCQEDMPYFRQKMLYEIYTQKLINLQQQHDPQPQPLNTVNAMEINQSNFI
uniref:Ubiquitin-like protease family profile domain-containing protein n=1 Tax=Panagrolaimus superbus TaxID=310955 RepID=A0A914Y9X6_9BILA